ncbi:T9SS type B sorting domain-containing protein [Flavobacterium sp. LPB0248]|uniref:T9SS type B sorting domain-containing protein n=1 Tax=Flavobacterium sp. LPB0248 TaxID=2614441 RepID=UPI0015A70505|nr:T9SS type B sorting domain-containing protein [Flavobacterium sp. LPB0248]QLC66877.1 T9SS type B sorting domain-containing protein [Flavobacterium sp. LPB0248]
MKKPTTLRTLIFVLALLFNFASHAQNWVAYNSKLNSSSNESLFLKANNQFNGQFGLESNSPNEVGKPAYAMVNPAIKYAQSPFLGTVSICPNDGKELPKLFLCGSNETRKIETGLENPRLIVWEKFKAGGSCLNVLNTNCANETAAASCWTTVGTAVDYVANEAGQFRVRIIDNAGVPNTFYFNVYQNTLDPGAIAKNDIIKYGTGCTLDGKITVNGFGGGYEYGLTTSTSPPSVWQESNIFTVTSPGSYNVFIRLKGVSGSCDFKVPNIVIKNTDFVVSTQINSPRCSGELGSIRVFNTDVNLKYIYKISGPTNITTPSISTPEYTFKDLASGTYTVETTIVGAPNCMKDTKTNQVIVASPNVLKNTSSRTKNLTACTAGTITGSATGGKAPLRYSVNIDDAGFVNVANVDNEITVAKAGTYVVRVEDANGCTADKTITIGSVVKPIYKVDKVDGNCTGLKGSITVNVTNPNGFTDIKYSIKNGASNSFVTTPTFSNLDAGIYYVVVEYKNSTTSGSNNSYCVDPPIMITVGAANPLSASAGIAALSGCGPVGEEEKGLARIVNPQGGIPFAGANPYKYKFMDSPWQDSNEMYIKPGGPYTFSIMDAAGCTYDMKDIYLDAKPAAPEIKILDPVFNCDGSATSTVQVNGGVPDSKYSYKYYIDGFLNPNTPSNVFLNVPQGPHTITVEYTVTSVKTYSNLLIEGFGSGAPTTTPGIAGTYCFNDQRVDPPYTCSLNGTGTRSVEDNQYSVASDFWRGDDYSGNTYTGKGAWFHFKDHTTSGADKNGRFLLINIGKAAGDYGVLYSKEIVDVIPDQPVLIDLYVGNLLKKGQDGDSPILIFELVDENGNVVATDKTGKIAEDKNGSERNNWLLKSLALNPGNNKKLTFKIRSGSTEYGGNDLVMDDIWVRQIPRACGTVKDYDITIDPSKRFNASITGVKDVLCYGDKNGELTINAVNFDPAKGFQYSIDGGQNWSTVKPVPAASTGSVTIKNLESKIYDILVRYEDKAESCKWPFSQAIKAPDVLGVTATITKPATCKIGATITVKATGGTPAYEFELLDAATDAVVKPRQPVSDVVAMTSDFVDVPKGTYKVKAYDKNGCQNNVDVIVTVNTPDPIEAVLATTSNLCYNPTDKATIVVTVKGGTAPFTYSLNGAPAVDSNTFKDLVPGSYVITVTDGNGCTDDTDAIVIEKELIVLASVTQTLKCVAPPATASAVITGKIEGGKSPFGVTLLSGPGTGTFNYPTSDTFTFTATVPGTYTFEISDSQKFVCKTTAQAEIKAPTKPVAAADPKDPKCFGAATGSVVLSGSLGSGSGYEYNFNNGGFKTNATYTGLSADITYSYQVRDDNGCVSDVKTFTLSQPTELKGDIKATEIGCNGNQTVDAVVTVTATGGNNATYQYSFNNNTSYSGKNTFSTSNAGDVTAYIKDANGCEIGPLKITIAAKNPITIVDIVSDSGLSCPANTATVTIKAQGGVSPIKYKIISPTVSAENTDGIFASLSPGLYTFQATDKNGCSQTVDHTVSGIPAIKVTGTVESSVKCFGDKGSVQFVVSGTTRFAYNIVNSANVSVGSNTDTTNLTIDLNNLPSSNYTITVTDKTTNCQAQYTVNLTQPVAALNVSATATKITCKNGKSDITVTVVGGTKNYEYAVVKSTDPAPTVFGTNDVLTVDTNLGTNVKWTVYVKDANGCPGNFTVDIESEETPTVTAVLDSQCGPTGTGNIFTITATGNGLAPLKYSIDGKTFKSGNTFNVPAGIYTVTVEDKNGCRATAPTSIVVSEPLTALASVTKGLDCSPTTPDAQITVDIIGGKGSYNYTIKKGTAVAGGVNTIAAGPIVLSVTAANADIYEFDITDANGCNVKVNATVLSITNPVVSVKSFANPKCDGYSDGAVELQATGGSGSGYKFNFNNLGFSDDAYYSNLPEGTYPYEVIDGKGCKGSGSITLTAPEKLIVSVDVVPFSCDANSDKVKGTVTLNVTSGGTAPYRYSFNGGGLSASPGANVLTLNDNTAGTDQSYTYTVTDANGCSVSGNGVLKALNAPKILEIKGTPILCEPSTSAKSIVTVTKVALTGVDPVTYAIIEPASETGNVTGATSGQFKDLPVGIYKFKVTDDNGCFAIGTYEVKPVVNIDLNASISKQVYCKDDNSGVIVLNVTGFNTTYKYSINGVETLNVSGSTITIPNLADGVYDIVVTDEETGCKDDAQLTITEPVKALTAVIDQKNANCKSTTSKITVTADGGTGTYSYAFVQDGTDPSTKYQASNIADLGVTPTPDWDVWVKDANGCTFKIDVTVKVDDAPTVTASAVGQCLGDGDYTITANGSGVGTLEYSIDGTNFKTDNKFIVTVAKDYTITVRDGNGCIATTTAPIHVYDKVTLSAKIDKNITCTVGSEAAIITLIPGGGKPGYTYTSNPTTGTFTSPGVFETTTQGNYLFTVTDANGCSATIPNAVIIKTPTTPVITSVTPVNILCNGATTGALTIVYDNTQGVGPFDINVKQYQDAAHTMFVNDFGTQTTGLPAGYYVVTLKDFNDCTVTASAQIKEPDPIKVVYTTEPLKCTGKGITQGSITIQQVTGGTPNYSYIVTGINNYYKRIDNQNGSARFEIVDFGLYQIRVEDSKGCAPFIIDDVLIAAPVTELGIKVSTTADCTNGGKATVEILGAFAGTGAFHFNIYNGTPQTWIKPANPTDPTDPDVITNKANGWIDETFPGSKVAEFTGLTPGKTYTFIIYDESTECYYFQTSKDPIPSTSTLAIESFTPQNITCKGANNGNVSFDITSPYATSVDVKYEIFSAFTNILMGTAGTATIPAGATVTVNPASSVPLPVGTYYVLITETSGGNSGCGVPSVNFNIKESTELLTVTASVAKDANCKNLSGIITANAVGGTPFVPVLPATGPAYFKYMLLLETDAAPTDPKDTRWVTNSTFFANAGSYTVYALDAYGCIADFDVVLTKDADPVVTLPAPFCYDGATPFTITVTGTTDPSIVDGPTYSVNGSAFSTNPDFEFNAAGNYNLTIKDGNGCTDTKRFVVYPQLKLKVEKKKGLDCTPTPNAQIELTASGGEGSSYVLEYSTNGGGLYLPVTFSTGNIFEATVSGNYIFRLTDTGNPATPSCFVTETLKIDAIPAITFDTIETNLTCENSGNGSITVNVTGGVGPFKFTLTDGTNTWGPQDESEFRDLAAGTNYTVTVQDGTSCQLQENNIVITEPKALKATASVAPFNCDPANNAVRKAIVTINVTAGTGTGGYKYKFGTATTYDDNNTLSVDSNFTGVKTISYSVQDKNLCVFNGTVDVDAYKKLNALAITGTDVTCIATKSDVTVVASGGYPGYTYEIVSPASAIGNTTGATSGIFTGLDPDTYRFKATDSNGCSIEGDHTVDRVVNITASGANVKNVDCNETPAQSNGTVAFTIANFKGTYNYNISGPSTGTATKVNYLGYDVITVTGLSVGKYTIDILDSVTGCTASAEADVDQPADPIAISIVSNTHANCRFGAKVTVKGEGGTIGTGYKYAFAADGATPVFGANASSVLDPSKTWIAYVQDVNNCTAEIPIPIVVDPNPTIDSVSNVCYTGDPITVTLSGTVATGTGAPRYNIGNGWTYDNTFRLDAPGKYEFSIMDGNGCTSVTKFEYTLNQELLLTATLQDDITCKPGAAGDAVIDLVATQGAYTLPYKTIQYSTDGITFNDVPSVPFTTNVAGTYTFRVEDAAGCVAVSKEVIVSDKTTPEFTFTKKDISCFGDNNGSFAITPSGGREPYQYSIDGGINYDPLKSEYIGLAPGTYHVYVKDVKECVVTHDIIIDEPAQLLVTPVVTPFGCSTTNDTVDAVVRLDATFGTAPYSYSFDNGKTFSDKDISITVNTAKTIKYVVVDKNGCRVFGDAIVNSYNPPKEITLDATPIYCNTPLGETTVTVTSVTGPPAGTAYTYEITSPAAFVVSNHTGVFPKLVAGNVYEFKVTDDASHCYATGSIEIKKASEISVTEQSSNDVFCNGDSTGAITFEISDYITAGQYDYNLSPNPLAIVPVQVGDVVTYSGLGSGTYTFTVTDKISGCTDAVTDFLINQPANPLDFTAVATDINCNKKTSLITVTVTNGTGTPGYKYAVLESGDTSIPVYGDSNVLEVDTNNGTKLAWDVYVKDLNNCSLTKVQNISTAPLPGGITIDPYSQCKDDLTGKYTFTVRVASGVGPFKYSLNGIDFQDSEIFIVDNAGTYTITVMDANGCKVTAPTPVIIGEPLVLNYKYEILPSCDENDGEITVWATGGSSSTNYVYTLDNNGFPQTGATYKFDKISSGYHFIEVVDTATGCKDKVDFTINPALPVSGFKVTGTGVTCFGNTNGTITASITAGTDNDNPIMYQLKGTTKGSPVPDVNLPAQESGSFINLKPGDYTVTAISRRGCKTPLPFRVTEPDLITVEPPVVSQYKCTADNTSNYATVTVDMSKILGGSGTYTYFQFIKNGTDIVYEGPSNVYTETDYSGGKYTVNVFDNKGCMGTSLESEVFPFVAMDRIDVAITPITCAVNESIVVSVKAFDGSTITPLEYTVTGVKGTVYNQTSTNGSFTGLAIGQYVISVRNPLTGCIIKKDHFVNDPNTFDLNVENYSNITCYGVFDGSVDLVLVDNLKVPTDDAGQFNYTITDNLGNPVTGGSSDATGKVTVSGLKAGNYNVKAVLVGPPYCEVETSFTILQPVKALEIFETHNPISCIPGNDGRIVISADGGWPGFYQYELTGPVNSLYSDVFEFTDLPAGTYTLKVKDLGGCEAITTVKLDNPQPITATATATATMLSCYGATDGIITVSGVTGGQGSNYAYILNMLSATPVISTASQDSPIFTGLGAGRYSVTIVDPLNCEGTTVEVTINEPTEIVPTLEMATGITCKTDATLTLTAVGGTGTYEYSADKNFTTVLGTLPATFPVSVGDHQYFVRDTNGCISSISNNVTIDQLEPLTLDVDLSNAVVYCKGDSTAAIDAVASGGLTNYVYTLFDGNGNQLRPAQSEGYFDLLPQGTYVVRVDSGDCQYDSAAIVITEPNEGLAVTSSAVDATCFAANDGKITVTATGGTGVIKYAISPNLGLFDDKSVFDRLAPGKYTILVQDENSCFRILEHEIKEPKLLEAKVLGPIVQEICDGDKDGEFSIEISGGTPPYTVSLDNENGTYVAVNGTQHTFSALKGGIHNVYIKDASCLTMLEVTMDKAVILNPTAEVQYDCVDNKQANMVIVTIDKSNNPTDVDYSLDNSGVYQPSEIFTNVAAGDHTIVARHTNGCEVRTPVFTVEAVAELGVIDVTNQSKDINTIVVKASGGVAPYEYSFNGEPFTSSNSYRIYKTGIYKVVVRDKNGCEATIDVEGIFYDFCMPNYFTPNGDGDGDNIGPGCGALAYKELTFDIYDRYGRVVAKYRVNGKWDGRYHGSELPTGDYWYVLKLNDPKDPREFVGHFTLYR